MSTIWIATTGNDSNPGTESSPKLTFDGAYSIASNGDTIKYKAGLYTDLWSDPIEKEITIEGPNAGISANNPNDISQPNPNRNEEAIIRKHNAGLQASNVTVDGIRLERLLSTHFYFLRPNSTFGALDNIQIKNCVFVDMVALYEATTTGATSLTNISVMNCRFTQPSDDAYRPPIWLDAPSTTELRQGLIIENNYFEAKNDNLGPAWDGSHINLIGVQDVFIQNNYFYRGGNFMLCDASAGYGCDNVHFTDNIIKQPTVWCIGFSGHRYGSPHANGSVYIERNKVTCDVSINARWYDYNVTYNFFYSRDAQEITIKDNEFTYFGTFPDTMYDGTTPADYSLELFGLEGSDINNVDFSGNTINIAKETKDSAKVVLSKNVIGNIGVYVNTEDDAPYGKFVGTLNIKNNKFDGLTSAIVAFNDSTHTYGGLDTSASVIARHNQFLNCEYGVFSSLGGIIDARKCYWGWNDGPSGLVKDPSSGNLADGQGCLVSENVLFYPYSKKTRPLVLPHDNAMPTGTEGSLSGQNFIEEASYEGRVPVHMNGKTRILGGNGSGGKRPLNGVLGNWDDR